MFLPKQKTTMRSQHRAGSATLEFAFIFPLLIAISLAILTISNVSVSQSTINAEARFEAFKHRHQPWNAPAEYVTQLDLSDIRSVAKILGPAPKMAPEKAVLEVHATQKSSVYLKSMESVAGSVSGDCFVMGAVWDHQEIEFKKHDRLTLTEKANYFGTTIDVNAFAAFKGLSGSTNIQSVGTAISNFQNSLRNITQGYNKLKADLQKLTRQLASEMAKQLPDASKIDVLKKSITKTKLEMGFLKNAKGSLVSGDLANSLQSLEQTGNADELFEEAKEAIKSGGELVEQAIRQISALADMAKLAGLDREAARLELLVDTLKMDRAIHKSPEHIADFARAIARRRLVSSISERLVNLLGKTPGIGNVARWASVPISSGLGTLIEEYTLYSSGAQENFWMAK